MRKAYFRTADQSPYGNYPHPLTPEEVSREGLQLVLTDEIDTSQKRLNDRGDGMRDATIVESKLSPVQQAQREPDALQLLNNQQLKALLIVLLNSNSKAEQTLSDAAQLLRDGV